MPVKPVNQIPSAKKPNGRPRKDYSEKRAELKTHARVECLIEDGLNHDEAKKLQRAISTTPGGHYFACVRSGRNLPDGCEGPAAVFGGYALDEEAIKRAKGYA